MAVFALVNSQTSGGYYIASTTDTMGWRGLPHDLADEMEDVRSQGEDVEEVSIGLDGDWFLRTNVRHSCKGQVDVSVSNVELFVQLAARGNLSLDQYAIQFFTFVPDPTGYVTVLLKDDRSVTRCAWHNVPAGLDQLLESEASQGVRHVAVGVNGSYVVILNTGVVRWHGVPPSLHQLLDDAERRRRGVKNVSLSLVAADWFFVEFADGVTEFVLPVEWHGTINRYLAQSVRERGPTMVSSFNTTPLAPRPPQSPDQLLYNSLFSSLNAYNNILGAGTAFGTPYAANPYLSMLSGLPQFAPQPAYANMFNAVQQPPQQSSGDRMFSLVDGTLKVAEAFFNSGIGSAFGLGF